MNGVSKEMKIVGVSVAEKVVHVQHVSLMVMMAIVAHKQSSISMVIAQLRQWMQWYVLLTQWLKCINAFRK